MIVEPIPHATLKRMLGQTVADALTASIPMTTIFPPTSKASSFRYPDAESMLESVVSFFENKKGVLPKAP